MQVQPAVNTTYSERLDRYQKQRDEWLRNLLMIVSPAVEQILRKIWQAADLCVQIKPNLVSLDDAYQKLLAQMRTWTDQEMRNELGGEKKTEEADLLLQMVVKTHATVLALSSAVRCRQVIAVPAVIKFYRNVIETCALELAQSDFFCTFDIDIRAKVRGWIDKIVIQQALGIVPVGLFAKTNPEEQNPRIRALQRAIERVENDIDLPYDDPTYTTPAISQQQQQSPMVQIQTTPVVPVLDKPSQVSIPTVDPPAPMAIQTEVIKETPPPPPPSPRQGHVTATQIAEEADMEDSVIEQQSPLKKEKLEDDDGSPLSIPMSSTKSPPFRSPSRLSEESNPDDREDELQSVMSDDEPI